MDRQLQRQTGVPVVDGGVGEEGQVGGELAPDPARKQKQIQIFPDVMPERSSRRVSFPEPTRVVVSDGDVVLVFKSRQFGFL